MSCVNIENVKALLVLPRELVQDSTIKVRGFVPVNATQFEVNFQKGPGLYDGDVMLHFSCRLHEGVIVRNHFILGQGWNVEERDGGVPFKKGCSFELVFTIEENHVSITVDGKHFTDYEFRLPLDSITHVRVRNHVNVFSITYEPAPTVCNV